jgi:hypothetical protein
VKYLCLAILIGLSGSAYAATGTSPPDDVPITITGATPPAQAIVAGFTTPVISSDFTSPAYANTSTWLDCAGASNSIWIHGQGFPSTEACPDITTDPIGGGQVLHVVLTPTATSSNGITSSGPNYLIPATSFYSEGVMRWDSTEAYSFALGPWLALFNSCSLEWDSFESIGSSGTDAAYHNCGKSGPLFAPGLWSGAIPNYPGFDITQYHTYGQRVTTDASTGIRQCIWIDNRFQACQTITAGMDSITSAQITTTPGTINLITGVAAFGGAVASNFNQYIKRMTLWSCPNWQSTNQVACKTSVLDPGGY